MEDTHTQKKRIGITVKTHREEKIVWEENNKRA